LKEAWNAPSTDQNLCSDFTLEEIAIAIKTFKAGKARVLTTYTLNSVT